MDASENPSVSVCLPVYNAERWVQRAVRSALEQTYDDLEIVVVDNASTDGTLAMVREIDDPRIRLFRNIENLGVYRNFNRTMALSRGRWIKLMCADDILYDHCVEEMLGVFRRHPRVALCFCPREVILEDSGDAESVRWKEKHEHSHLRFGPLSEVTDGDSLLARWVEDELRTNWIGEPTNVMMSRDCLQRVGTFPLRMENNGDIDLWARAMAFGDVGFVDRPLVGYLVRGGSVDSVNRETGRAWLDRVWLLEGLLGYEPVRKRFPELRRLRRRAAMRALQRLVTGDHAPGRGRFGDARAYVSHRLRRSRQAAAGRLYGSIADRGTDGETVPVSPVPGASRSAAPGSGR